MNFVSLLAQTPTLTPTDMPVATALASVTPTPTPTPTPALHVVVDQQPFWNSGLSIFIFIIIAIGVGVVIGLVLPKGGTNGLLGNLFNFLNGFLGKLFNLFSDFTNILAYLVIVLAFSGIFWLAHAVLSAGKENLETAKNIFAAVLALFGTWVGAVLAHYFQKESLAAANQSITDLAKTVSNAGKLASLPVKDFMIGPGKIVTLPPDLQGKQNSDIQLKDISDHLKKVKRDRIPLFDGNQGSGVVKNIVHLSNIEKYLADKAINPPAADAASTAATNIAALTLADLLKEFQQPLTFKNFSFVKESATLADAKAAMDTMTSTPGTPGNCYDIFVTATGSPSETVVGWITNDIINENAKV
jgi:hypothetical protein